jgi:hypothetical protein
MLALLVVAGFAAAQAQSVPTLSCAESEIVALRSASPGVQRSSKHRLDIRWVKGTRSFADSGVVEGDMDGIRYQYCGFALGYHLIRKADNGLFTGVLLDTTTGKALPAGQTVIFAPGGERYFATQRPDGLDGEEWLIYSRTGSRLWKGVSGILAKSPQGEWDYFVATLERPHWSAAGELEATLRCTADRNRTTTVTLRAAGRRYAWDPPVRCAASP